jgi:hypothetical protein
MFRNGYRRTKEVDMEPALWKVGLAGLAAVLIPLLGSVAHAQKTSVVGTGRHLALQAQSKVILGPDQEVIFSRWLSEFNSSVPDELGTAARWEVLHAVYEDLSPGAMYYVGRGVATHPSGDQMFQVFEGKVGQMVKHPDGSWEVSWEGTHRCVGGTGRLEGMKCSGRHKGKASPAGITWEWNRESELRN